MTSSRLIAVACGACAFTACPATTVASATPSPYGAWNCELPVFTLSETRYSLIPDEKIVSVERSGNDYMFEFSNGYSFALIDVTAQTAIWNSPHSGDIFDCVRQ